MGPAAAALFGYPSRRLTAVGVTGTNGKTTTTYLLRSVFEAAGWPCGLIGTLSGTRTTPEAPELQGQLAAMVDDGRRAVAMEVSSHALAQHRVDGTWFAVAVFTNLSRDHLDYHRSLDEYFAAKARLFAPDFTAHAVVDLDDAWGRRLAARPQVETTGYSLEDATDLKVGVERSRFRWRGTDVELGLGGRFNVRNALAAATAAAVVGVDAESIARGLSGVHGVPGRFEPIGTGSPFRVVVDYAHTPDGLDQVLRAARDVTPDGRVLVVFGAGGDRDPTKRPEMGSVASRLADLVVLTSDNPRSEDPASIIAAVRSGYDGPAALVVEPDRRAAIAAAIAAARPGDMVVIAGKGHETTQTMGTVAAPFDDRVVAADELARRELPRREPAW
jgi:UDP-N-acetylmuramoyl-L-alanyl-D-glutamate--2,6-diaminopimelate ligase